jgi:hypothetical protein
LNEIPEHFTLAMLGKDLLKSLPRDARRRALPAVNAHHKRKMP